MRGKIIYFIEDKISPENVWRRGLEAINLVLGVYEDELISRLINELGSKGTPFPDSCNYYLLP